VYWNGRQNISREMWNVGRLCIASLLRVSQKGNGVLVYEIIYRCRDKRSRQLYNIQLGTLKRYKCAKFQHCRKITACYYKELLQQQKV
jgi:hypothetical protein